MSNINTRKLKMKNRSGLSLIGVFLLLSMVATLAQTTFTWTGAGGDNILGNTNNWSPVTVNRPNGGNNDILLFNGTVPGALLVTNGPGNGVGLDSSPGFGLTLESTQTGAVTIVQSNTFGGRIRLSTNMIVSSGAGALTFGNGGATPFPIALGIGNGILHQYTNNSAFPVTFNTETFFLMGGGGAHTLRLVGTGDWDFETKFQPQNGAALALNINGSGTVTYKGASAPSTSYGGTYGNLIVTSGILKLSLADPNAIGVGNTFVLAGGSFDNTVPGQILVNNNPIQWNGDFNFIGTESLDMGYGVVTMNANRIVTISANTLTVGGQITGSGRLTKAGAGILFLNNGFNSYTGGTIISNGVVKLSTSGDFPSGTSTAENLSTFATGTLDLNGNSITISALNGTGGGIDETSGGSPTLTVGDFNASGSFAGSIKNSSGSLALVKTGNGSLTLSGDSTYSGGTTVSAGTLLVNNTSGSGVGSGAVSVSSGAVFGGSGAVGGTVNWQSGSSATFVQGSPLAVSGSVMLNGNPVTVNVPGESPLAAGNYTLMTYNAAGSSGAFQSSSPNFTGAGVSAGASVSVTTASGLVSLVVSAPPGLSATWTNNGDGNWSVPANWSSNPQVPKRAGEVATLGLGSAFTTVTLDLPVTNGFVSFNNSNSFAIANAGNALTFDNTNGGAALIVVRGTSNSIASPVILNDSLAVSVFPGAAVSIPANISGSDGLTVSSGAGTLTLSGNNSYGPSTGTVGTTFIGSGDSVLVLGNNNALSTGDVSLYRNATIRAATALNTPNNISISNTVTATIDNNGNNVTLLGVVSGAGALTKNGNGTLNLNNANSYAGNTAINNGTAKLANVEGIPGGAGKGDVFLGTNTLLDLNGFSPTLNALVNNAGGATVDSTLGGAVTLTVGASGTGGTYNGTIRNTSGTLALVKTGAGTETLAGTNTYSGGTTINAGVLRVGNGNTNASGLGTVVGLGTGSVVANGVLEFNLAGTNTFTNSISGSGGLNLANVNMTLRLTGNNSAFTGGITNNGGRLWITNAAAMGTGPKSVVVAGAGISAFTQFHLDGRLRNITLPSDISLVLSYNNGVLVNEGGTNTILGRIYSSYGGGDPSIIVTNGYLIIANDLSTDGNANNRVYGFNGVGGLISGAFVDYDNGGGLKDCSATVNSGTWTFTGASTTAAQGGSGATLTAAGGKLVFNGSWANGFAAVNSGGTLSGGGMVSNLTVNAGGVFVPGDYGSIGSFTVSNYFTLSGSMYISLNKSLGQPNSLVNIQVNGTTNVVANSGSSITVSNLGPSLVAGDSFYVFNQAVTNGNLIVINGNPGAGLGFTNYLDVDGSIKVVQTVATNPTNIIVSASGNILTLSWPSDHLGWTLQTQTNSLSAGISTNWVDVPNSTSSTQSVITINPTNPTVFYRLKL